MFRSSGRNELTNVIDTPSRGMIARIDTEQVEDVDMRPASVALPADHGARKC